jgi:glyoxylate/hydroxypyruvate reductase A
MTLLVIAPTIRTETWTKYLQRADLTMPIRVWPDTGDAGDVQVLALWKHPPGVLGRFPNLKGIVSLGVGVDHILADPDLPPDIPITRVVERYMADSMSEYVVLAILSHCRHFVHYFRDQDNCKWLPRVPLLARDLTVGILGLGQLGGEVARKLLALGFGVRGWTRNPHAPHARIETFAGPSQLSAFLSGSNILVCLLPLTPATRGILNRTTFVQLPPGAYLINVARGGHLIESDLLPAIDAGQLSGACLDVFDSEPLPSDHPFWRHPQIVVTPHISSLTHPRDVAPQIASNYQRIIQGRAPLHRVDRKRGY